MSVVAMLLAYGNAAAAFAPRPLVTRGLAIDAPVAVRDAFMTTGMFNSFSLRNSDHLLWGKRSEHGYAKDRGRWIRLPLSEHLPLRKGMTYSQLYAVHHRDVLGVAAQHRAWRFIARKIRLRHNRLHPERAIARVQIGSIDWPKGGGSYRARKLQQLTRRRIWFVEPAP